jgi:hypothetical protein
MGGGLDQALEVGNLSKAALFHNVPKLRKLDVRFGTWNVRSLYMAGSLMTVAREISKYKLDLVRVQVRRDRGVTKPAGEYTFLYGKGNENHELGRDYFLYIGESVRRFQCQSRSGGHFKPTLGSESLHENSNDNGVRVVNFPMTKNLIVKYSVPTS